MDVTALLGSIQTAISLGKSVADGLKTIKEVDQQMALLEVRQQQVTLMGSLQDAREKILELQSQLALQQSLIHDSDGNIYWKSDGQTQGGPYCSTCYCGEGKAMTLTSTGDESWWCQKCKSHFTTKAHDAKQRQIEREVFRGF